MRKLAAVAFSFSAAVLLCNYALPMSCWTAAGAVCALMLLCTRAVRPGRRRLLLTLILAGLAAGFFWTRLYDQVFFDPARQLDGQTVRLSAEVVDYPRQSDYGWQVSARIKTQRGTALKVILYTDEQGESLRPGDRIESVTYCTLGTRSSAGEEITYYTAKGIFLWGSCYGTLSVERPAHIPLDRWPACLARLLQQGIEEVFPEREGGIVRAVVTGSREKLTDAFTSSLERSGLAHVVAVSGMHLSCFAGMLVLLLGRGKRLTAAIVIGWSVLFCGIAGSTPSVSRAAVMIALLHLAPLLGRERDDATALGFALMLLLIWNPYSAAHVGLQLSFASVAGIFLLSHRIQSGLLRLLRLERKSASKAAMAVRRCLKGPVCVVSATLGAMAATVPLTALHFGIISLIAPVSNLLTLWAVTLVFAGGMTAGALSLLWAAPARLLAIPVSWLAAYVDTCTALCARFTFAALSLDSVFYRAWLILAYATVIWSGIFRRKIRPVIPAACIVLTLAVAVTAAARQFDSGEMRAVVLDVGQGQSVILRCGDSVTVVDCGGDGPDDPGDLCADYLQSRGRARVDLLVLTHYHDDHANAVPQLLRRMKVGKLLLPDVEPESPLRQEILALTQALDIPVHFITRDTEVDTGEGCAVTLIPPMTAAPDANERGLTVLARAGEKQALITGDMAGETELLLLEHIPLPDIELLIAGHHGSKYSTTQQLLDTVRPEYCVISAGANNRYGHPARETLARLYACEVQVLRTDLSGTVALTLN